MLLTLKLGRFQMHLCIGKVYDLYTDDWHQQGCRVAWLGKKNRVWNFGKGVSNARQ
jgi:hypothetical protein